MYIGVNDDGYVVDIKDSKRMLENISNKINDKLGIITSIHRAMGLKMFIIEMAFLHILWTD